MSLFSFKARKLEGQTCKSDILFTGSPEVMNAESWQSYQERLDGIVEDCKCCSYSFCWAGTRVMGVSVREHAAVGRDPSGCSSRRYKGSAPMTDSAGRLTALRLYGRESSTCSTGVGRVERQSAFSSSRKCLDPRSEVAGSRIA